MLVHFSNLKRFPFTCSSFVSSSICHLMIGKEQLMNYNCKLIGHDYCGCGIQLWFRHVIFVCCNLFKNNIFSFSLYNLYFSFITSPYTCVSFRPRSCIGLSMPIWTFWAFVNSPFLKLSLAYFSWPNPVLMSSNKTLMVVSRSFCLSSV